MIITSSTIQLSAEHQQLEIVTQQRSQQSMQQRFQQNLNVAQAALSTAPQQNSSVLPWRSGLQSNTIAPLPTLLALFVPLRTPTFVDAWKGLSASTSVIGPLSGSSESRGGSALLQALLQALLGAISTRLQQLALPGSADAEAVRASDVSTTPPNSGNEFPPPAQPLGLQRTLKVEVRFREQRVEEECTRFCAAGSVTTADGETLALDLSLEMYRRYESSLEFSRQDTVQFTDPLVVNFDGNTAELTAEQYSFDLDADGHSELISFVTANSGLLALDRNQDGVINDGRELFGALSGNGFADLAAFDDDRNGFIDAGDAIFSELRLWRKQTAEDQLLSLKEQQIGAIYLGATETPFALKDDRNHTLGRVRQSGIYLQEDGRVGSVQQIDMAV